MHNLFNLPLGTPYKIDMRNIPKHLASVSLTVWVGSLWAIGYLAVPILFQVQTDRQLAGMLAGRMFESLGYVGLVCGGYLLLYRCTVTGKHILHDRLVQIVTVMLLITLANHCYIQPLMADMKSQALPLEVMQSTFAGQFKMWHGISSILYLIESLLGAWLVIRSFNFSSK